MAQPKEPEVKPDKISDDIKDEKDLDKMFVKYTNRIKLFEKNICEFPVDNNKIISNDWTNYRDRIYFHMQQTYPLVHGGILSLVYNFLLIKKNYGSLIEKNLYKNMTMVEFFDRISTKRAVVFYRPSDDYLLRNGYDGEGQWQLIGTDNEENIKIRDPEKKPLLSEYLSYDELIISALCGISSPTHFINNGDRRNCGRIQRMTWTDFYPLEGIYMGLIGARFEKNNVMENSLMAINRNQNTKQNGYGAFKNDDNIKEEKKEEKENNNIKKEIEKEIEKEIDDDILLKTAEISQKNNKNNNKIIWRAFEKFYDRQYLPTFDEINSKFKDDEKMQQRYLQRERWRNSDFLDIDMFRRRIRISMEIFLFDADRRGKHYKQLLPQIYGDKLDKTKPCGAYCHVVGLGTGVWSFDKSEQNRIIVKVTKEIIEETNLENIDFVYFSWMTSDAMNISGDKKKAMFDQQTGDKQYSMLDVNGHLIGIEFGRRSPAEQLDEPYHQCLIVSMYAWDSNSFPGNEYYHGMLMASGDPAAASCSTISFIQNSQINKEYINGKNTAIYFYDQETQKYQFYKLNDIDFENNKEKWLRKSVTSIPYKRKRLNLANNDKK